MSPLSTQVLSVGILGLLGVFVRWALDSAIAKWMVGFPFGILSINFLGSLLAGVIYVIGVEKNQISLPLHIGLLVGFCGGFTTFSAYSLQSILLLEKGSLLQGLSYFALSPLMGLIGAYLGLYLARL